MAVSLDLNRGPAGNMIEKKLTCPVERRFNQRLYNEVNGITNDILRPVIENYSYFEEGFSDKVHATTPKGIVGGFEFTVFSKKIERIAREALDVCLRLLKKSNKSRFDSYSVRNSVLIISLITFRDCRVDIFSDNLSRIAVYGKEPRHKETLL